VLTGAYQGFFTAIAGASAALTGLLFVALSVTSRSRLASYPTVIRDVRAAASLLAFTNVLTVSLFSLVPETNTGYPALVAGVFGLMFTAAGVRSIIASPETTAIQVRRQASLVAALLIAFGPGPGSSSATGTLASSPRSPCWPATTSPVTMTPRARVATPGSAASDNSNVASAAPGAADSGAADPPQAS
jgi:hypothetical protein